jgi:hypothetical protein
VYVAGALVKRKLQQPIDQVDNVLVIGIQVAGFAKFKELFKILDIAFAASCLNSSGHLGLGRFVCPFMFTSNDIINLPLDVSCLIKPFQLSMVFPQAIDCFLG